LSGMTIDEQTLYQKRPGPFSRRKAWVNPARRVL
jgi:hypothetical protein